MSKEILAVPEEYLGEVIYTIRAGLEYVKDPISHNPNFRKLPVSLTVIEMLEKWCEEESMYLWKMTEKENWENDLG